MTSEQPGQGASPDPGEPAPAPEWTTPPPPSSPGVGPTPGDASGAPQQPATPPAPTPAAPEWGQPAPAWGAPAPQQPAPQPGWAAQPQPAPQPTPQQPAWNPAPQQPAQPQQPGWGQQPAPAPGQYGAPQQPVQQPGQYGAPQQPAPQQGWGQQPAPQQPQQQGQWVAPAAGAAAYGVPPQGPAPQQGWGAPGQPQPGWQGGAPPAQSSNNGCLKGCLIAAVILVILAIVGGILFVVFVGRIATDVGSGLGVDQNGNLKDCSIVSSAQLQTVLGKDTEAHPLAGIANAAIGLTLDKRVLPDADNCYILSGASTNTTQNTGGFGRIAKYSSGDASSVFDKEKSNAQSGQYFAVDVSGAGDQAFCTGWSDKYPATGALVRKGNDLIYVSLLIGTNFGNFNQASNDAGVVYSSDACDQAVSIAKLAVH